MFSYNKLRGRIVEKFGTLTAFAKHINRSKAYVSYKLNGRCGFLRKDIDLWAEALDITLNQYGEYFFAKKH